MPRTPGQHGTSRESEASADIQSSARVPASSRLPRTKLTWITILYFAQGFPFGLVVDNLPVYFRLHGVSLTDIGLMRLLGMPWTLKVLWSPLVDRRGHARGWITGSLGVMALTLYILPFLPPGEIGWSMALLLLVLCIASATQDIAIDGHSIRLLDPGEEGAANGVRVAAYRAALIVSGGGLVMLSDVLAWTGVFHVAAGILLVLAYVVWTGMPSGPTSSATSEDWWQPFADWLRRPGAFAVVAFLLTYKLGDSSMGPMVKPFWVDRGFTAAEIGLVSTTLGIAASVAGALLGGVLTSRWGIYRGLAVLGILQAVSNLGYAAAAWWEAGRLGVYAASLSESFTGGMGTAAFLAFLMSACDKRRAATEYAMLSAIFGLSRELAGGFSGWAATELGYAPYFAVTFLLALPSLALLPLVQRSLSVPLPDTKRSF